MPGGSRPICLLCCPCCLWECPRRPPARAESPIERDEVVLVDALVPLAAHEPGLFMSAFSVFAPESDQSVGMPRSFGNALGLMEPTSSLAARTSRGGVHRPGLYPLAPIRAQLVLVRRRVPARGQSKGMPRGNVHPYPPCCGGQRKPDQNVGHSRSAM